MLECVFVPYALLVEHEELLRLAVAEDQAIVEEVTLPHQLVSDHLGRDALQVGDVNDVLVDSSEEERLVEYNLLGVRQEFCVPCEVSLLNPSPGHEHGRNKSGKKEVVAAWHQKVAADQCGTEEVTISVSESPVCLLRLVQELSVFVSLNSIEACVGVVNETRVIAVSKKHANCFEDKSILEQRVAAKVEVCGVLVRLIIH